MLAAVLLAAAAAPTPQRSSLQGALLGAPHLGRRIGRTVRRVAYTDVRSPAQTPAPETSGGRLRLLENRLRQKQTEQRLRKLVSGWWRKARVAGAHCEAATLMLKEHRALPAPGVPWGYNTLLGWTGGVEPVDSPRWSLPVLEAADAELAPRDWTLSTAEVRYTAWDVGAGAGLAALLLALVGRARVVAADLPQCASRLEAHVADLQANVAVLRYTGNTPPPAMLHGPAADLLRVGLQDLFVGAQVIRQLPRSRLPRVVVAEMGGGPAAASLMTALRGHGYSMYAALCREYARPAVAELTVGQRCASVLKDSASGTGRPAGVLQFMRALFDGRRDLDSAFIAGAELDMPASLPAPTGFDFASPPVGAFVLVAVPAGRAWSTAPSPPVQHPAPRSTSAAVCCRRTAMVPCPEGWEPWPPGGNLTTVQTDRPGAVPCTVSRQGQNGTGSLAAVACSPPAGYSGPCGKLDGGVPQSPGCGLSAREEWARRCGLRWPCAEWAESWDRCSMRCRVEPTQTCRGGFLDVVVQLPPAGVPMPLERRIEFATSLRCTLVHEAVRRVHLLQEEPSPATTAADLLHRLVSAAGPAPPHRTIDPCRRARVRSLRRRVLYGDAVRFADALAMNSTARPTVLLTNADCSPGAGWTQRTVDEMLSASDVLPLTRYEDETCSELGPPRRGVCDCRSSDGACIDSYLLRPPLPPALAGEVDFRFGGLWGSENVFMETLRAHGLNLTNRCGVLRMEHHHCSQARPTQDGRDVSQERKPPGPLSWRVARPVLEGDRRW